jgi:hypothetical protein
MATTNSKGNAGSDLVCIDYPGTATLNARRIGDTHPRPLPLTVVLIIDGQRLLISLFGQPQSDDLAARRNHRIRAVAPQNRPMVMALAADKNMGPVRAC